MADPRNYAAHYEHGAASSRSGARSDLLGAPDRGDRGGDRRAGGGAAPSPPPPTGPTALAGSSTPTLTPSPGAPSSSTPAAASPESATPKPSKTPTAGPVACTVSELRPTLTGKQRLKIKERNAFTLWG